MIKKNKQFDDLDINDTDRSDLLHTQEMNERLEKVIRICDGKPYEGQDIIKSKQKEIRSNII